MSKSRGRVTRTRTDQVEFEVGRRVGGRTEPLWCARRNEGSGVSYFLTSSGAGAYIWIRDEDIDLFVELAKTLRDHIRTQPKRKP